MFGKTETINLTVNGMHCDHCKKRVEDAIKAQKGVKKVSVSLENSAAQVEVSAGKADADAIVNAVNEIGFEAKVK